MTDTTSAASTQILQLADALSRDGVAGIPGAFPRHWGDQLRVDFDAALAQAGSRPDGTVPRGPNRYYFSVHPEALGGFADLIGHPVVAGLSEHLLGPDYQFVEVAFDVPLPGAVNQPWHRDFPMPEATRRDGRLTSLAFNVTTVDVARDMGPFEVAPGTHRDGGDDFDHGMFPPTEAYPRYEALGELRRPQLGDMSVRSGLTVHRGTANVSATARGVLVLGVVAPEVETEPHDLQVSREYYSGLPGELQRHLRCTVVERLSPLVQRHSIEGLVMGG